jgi:hypothetical protein
MDPRFGEAADVPVVVTRFHTADGVPPQCRPDICQTRRFSLRLGLVVGRVQPLRWVLHGCQTCPVLMHATVAVVNASFFHVGVTLVQVAFSRTRCGRDPTAAVVGTSQLASHPMIWRS